jgi:hypothetical protein
MRSSILAQGVGGTASKRSPFRIEPGVEPLLQCCCERALIIVVDQDDDAMPS